MKLSITLLFFFLIIQVGCSERTQSSIKNDDLIVVDVTKSYPTKELVLQDFMDVEYIPLESSNDDFLCEGRVLAVGKLLMLIRNSRDDGDIFIFDRSGNALRKINRKGGSGEEYLSYYEVVLDEDNEEIYVNDDSKKKVLVYDLYGNFKRDLKYKEGTSFKNIYNYSKECFICWDAFYELHPDSASMISFYMTSKQDASIAEEIMIPFEHRNPATFVKRDNRGVYTVSPGKRTILQYRNKTILAEPSSDTIYDYLSDHKLVPLMVRIPSIQSMSTKVFLFITTITDSFYFMRTVKMEYDFDTNEGLFSVPLMYDRQAKSINEYRLFNADYINKETSTAIFERALNEEIATFFSLDATSLVEDYEKGRLRGKLKEIAATLDEESNPVLMLVKHKQ